MSTLNAMLEAAKAGYFVFPVRLTIDDGGKKIVAPLDRWRHWSSREPGVIEKMMHGKTYTAYGIDTGKSGVVVVDLDRDDVKDGLSTWESCVDRQNTAFVVTTRSGGQHLYFRDDEGTIGLDQGRKIGAGVDVRGVGGFVFGPGSYVQGRPDMRYSAPDIIPVFQLPQLSEGLRGRLRAKEEHAVVESHYAAKPEEFEQYLAEHRSVVKWAANAPDGERDLTCHRALSVSMQLQFCLPDDVLDTMQIIEDYETHVPYEIKDLEGKADRAFAWAAVHPRAWPVQEDESADVIAEFLEQGTKRGTKEYLARAGDVSKLMWHVREGRVSARNAVNVMKACGMNEQQIATVIKKEMVK